MAEIAPLTSVGQFTQRQNELNANADQAYGHARHAVEEFEKHHFTPAAEQHQQAATDYARAARGSSDHEALRVLKLLEDQHQKLACLVKARDVSQQEPDESATSSKPSQATTTIADTAAKAAESRQSSRPKPTTSAMAASRVGSSARDSSPSLARDIATRRGIPQPGRNPPNPSAQARTRQLSPESQRKLTPRIPPSIVDSQSEFVPTRATKQAEDDEGFAKFYSNLTTGTMSKLSSALAYAGLPLTAEDAVKADQAERQKNVKRSTVLASNDPDVKKIFSKAALEAIEDEHRQRGTFGHGFGAAESFYVVPAGGGTVSYAEIAGKKQQETVGDDDDDLEFVDAKETPSSSSSKNSRISSRPRSSFGKARTHEELELENTTLKATLEHLSTRLSDFEAHAQDASMAALEQSMATLKGGPVSDVRSDNLQVQERLGKLEAKLQDAAQKEENLKILAERQAKELKKYRYHFDELKKGAHKKEKVKQEKRGSLGGGDGVAGE